MKIGRMFGKGRPGQNDVSRQVDLGNKANARRDWPEAARYYEAALARDPSRVEIWVQLGHARKEQGYLLAAEDAYRRAAWLDLSAADPHLQLGHVLRLQDALPEALAAYRAARARLPDDDAGLAELLALERDHPDLSAPMDGHLHPRPRAVSAGQGEVGPLAAVAAAHGLGAELLQRFDSFHYFQAHPTVRAVVKTPDVTTCLTHFCTVGIGQALSISAHDAFDPAFYRETYLGGMPFTDGNAYRHWLEVGTRRHAAPNRARWLASLLGDGVGVEGVDLRLVAAFADAGANALPWTVLVERFVHDAGNLDIPLDVTPRTAAVLHAVASVYEHRAERANSTSEDLLQRAFVLRQRVAAAAPDFRDNLDVLARRLRERGVVAAAADIYARLVRLEREPAGSFIALADCQERLGQTEQALVTLAAARRSWPGERKLARLFAAAAEKVAARAWERGRAAARVGRMPEGQRVVAAAAALISTAHAPDQMLPPRVIRCVALVANLDLLQCRFYRVDQRVEQLERAGYTVVVFDHRTELEAFEATIHGFEAAIFFRVAASPAVIAAIQAARALGLVTFYEVDDLIFDAAHYPDGFESYAGGLDHEEYLGLGLGVPLFAQAIRLCEHAIVSTPALAEAIRPMVSGRCFVHRNGLPKTVAEDVPPVAKEAPGETLTILYGTGTLAHKLDFQELVEPALVELVRKRGTRVRIVLIGAIPLSPALAGIAANLVMVPVLPDVRGYWSLLAQADINIAVLKPSFAADCKSEIKWLEAARFGVPSALSEVAAYRDAVHDGETGLICSDAASWQKALGRLAADAGLRRRIGGAARAAALAHYGPDVMSANIAGILQSVSPAPDTRPVLLVVNVYYPPQAIGGATRVVHDNVSDLTAHYGDRYRIEVFTTFEHEVPYRVSSYVEDGVRVSGCGPSDAIDVDHLPEDERVGAIFAKLLESLKPALVHFHCIQRLTVSVVEETARRKIPYVVTVHDAWWISDRQFVLDDTGHARLYNYAAPLETLEALGPAAVSRMSRLRPVLEGARRVLAVSEPFAALHRQCGVRNVITVANGVSDLVPQERPDRAEGPVRLGFIGGLARHKGYDLLQIALRAQPYTNLSLLAIDHAFRPGERRQDQWGSVPVVFEPKRSQDRVASLYAEIDVLVAPSIWPESFGLATREALACGCWVIASDRGSIGETVADGVNGFVIDVATPDGLIAALARIDADPTRFRRSPPPCSPTRLAVAQAHDLAALYSALLIDGNVEAS